MSPVGAAAKQPRPVSTAVFYGINEHSSLDAVFRRGKKKKIVKTVVLWNLPTTTGHLSCISQSFRTGLRLNRKALIDRAKFWKHLRGSLAWFTRFTPAVERMQMFLPPVVLVSVLWSYKLLLQLFQNCFVLLREIQKLAAPRLAVSCLCFVVFMQEGGKKMTLRWKVGYWDMAKSPRKKN